MPEHSRRSSVRRRRSRAIGLFESALKAAAMVQTSVRATPPRRRRSRARRRRSRPHGAVGLWTGGVGAGYIGNEIYKNYNAMDGESHPATGPSAWAMISTTGPAGSLVAGKSAKSAEARRHWRHSASGVVIRFWRRRFADAVSGGREHVSRLEGAAQIGVKIEVSADNETVIRQVIQTLDARGNLRADTGRTMPEASPGASRGE